MPALIDRPKPYVMAHRGAPAHAPENTLGSFQLALDAGADIVETDLWFTADGELVCHHDQTVTRMTGESGQIGQMTLRQLQALRVRSAFDARFPSEHIPSLAELLDMLPRNILLTVELKDPLFADPRRSERLARQVAERVSTQDVVAISFKSPLLQGLRAAEPAFPTGYLAVMEPFPTQRADVFGPFWPLLFINPAYVAMAHRRSKWVAPLDPTPHKRLKWYLRLGVDAILTDDPAATRALIDQLRSRVHPPAL